METVSFAMQKGGVGKTNMARHLAFALLELGKRVLVVDLDGQRNMTKTFAGVNDTEGFFDAYDLFIETTADKPLLKVDDKLTVIPGVRRITDVGELPLNSIFNLSAHLDALAEDFDFCVIDNAPSLGKPLFASLIASTYVINPLPMCDDAISGLSDLLADISYVKTQNWNPDLINLGFVPSKITKSAYDTAALDECRAMLGPLLLKSVVWERPSIKAAKLAPVWRTATGGEARTKAAMEMRAAITEILEKMGVK